MSVIQKLALSLLLAASSAASAVHLGDSGQGDALILPYWTTQGGNDTLLTLRNSHDAPVAIKVRVIGADGAELHALNLYLDARVTWTAGFSTFDDGAPRLFSVHPSCTLPILAQEAPFGTPQFGLPEAHGYLEIIEMGVAEPGVATDAEGDWQTCVDLMQRLETGPWFDTPNAGLLPPAGRIGATAQIIDVADGGMTTVEAIGLAGFSNIAQHTDYRNPEPNLASAHDAGTPSGATSSQVCLPSGCRTDTWTHPVEAVAAVLSVASLEADFSINPYIGGLSEMVLVRPLERFEGTMGAGFRVDAVPMLSIFDRLANAAAPQTCPDCPIIPEPPPGSPVPIDDFPVELPRDEVVTVVSFNASGEDFDTDQISPLLGAPFRPTFSLVEQDMTSGFASLTFENDDNGALVSDSGDVFAGEPVIGFSLQQFSNGFLVVDGLEVFSNYRSAQQPVRRRVVLIAD